MAREYMKQSLLAVLQQLIFKFHLFFGSPSMHWKCYQFTLPKTNMIRPWKIGRVSTGTIHFQVQHVSFREGNPLTKGHWKIEHSKRPWMNGNHSAPWTSVRWIDFVGCCGWLKHFVEYIPRHYFCMLCYWDLKLFWRCFLNLSSTTFRANWMTRQ